MQEEYKFPKTGIHKYVMQYIQNLPDLSGKSVLDIPCGDGRSSYEFKKKNAKIIALDLFPEFMTLKNVKSNYADLQDTLPIETESIDYIICQEGIEHISNQFNVLSEFNRVLKKDGILLLTTPNNSHMRARISMLLLETDLWKRMPPTEIDTIWFANSKEKIYFGHLFLLGVQHLESLLVFNGFKTIKRLKTNIGITSLLLSILSYPILIIFSMLSYIIYRKKNTNVAKKYRYKILWERIKLNLSPTTLFYKHIFWEIKKINSTKETIVKLQDLHQNIKN